MQGEYVIFVGEGECGCTADDAFFELMEVGCIQYLARVLLLTLKSTKGYLKLFHPRVLGLGA